MIPDDVLPAAFAVVQSPKRYALLLGSGISRDAGILTGGEITRDRIRQIANGLEEPIEGKPEDWYQQKYGTEPTFSDLFNGPSTPEDREAALHEYFVVEGSVPQPTKAHRTIARMVKEGLISLIITTNFDDLLEQALRDEGVRPVVITEGSDPAKMSVIPDQCRIVKVNGDYPDTPLKMTPKDLASYKEDLIGYLDRIFSECGLIICGGSMKDDTGLVEILAKERVRRHTVYWCHLKERADIPQKIIDALEPATIRISSADEFFGELYMRIEVLRGYHRNETLTPTLAVRKVKDALMGPNPDLIVPDVINAEVEKVLAEVEKDRYILPGTVEAQAVYYRRLAEIEDAATPLAAMLATLAYYDNNGDYAALIADTIERLVNPKYIEPFAQGSVKISGRPGLDLSSGLKNLRYYPALLAVYAAGIAAVKEERLTTLDAVISKPQMFRYHGVYQQKTEFFDRVNVWNILECDHHWIIDLGQETFGSSEHPFYTYPFLTILGILKPLIPNEKRYAEYFDIFEYLYCLSFLDSWRENWELFEPLHHRSNLQMKCVPDSRGYDLYSTPTIPPYVVDYLAGIIGTMKSTAFFDGDAERFGKAHTKFAECFKIEAPELTKRRIYVRASRRPGT